MSVPSVRSRLRRALALGLLLVLAGGALAGALRQAPRIRTIGHGLETATQVLLGGLSLWLAARVGRSRRPSRASLQAWRAVLVTTAVASALVWGPPMLLPTIVFAAAALGLAAVVGWALRATDAA